MIKLMKTIRFMNSMSIRVMLNRIKKLKQSKFCSPRLEYAH